MFQDRDSKSFSRYLPTGVRDRKWGWYVTTVGEARIREGQCYPPAGYPKGYHFDCSRGRVLDCYALIYISSGRGVFESKRSSEIIVEAGNVILLFPGIRHRYRPDNDSGWEERWLGFDGDVVRRWARHGFFSPRAPIFKTGQEETWLALLRN